MAPKYGRSSVDPQKLAEAITGGTFEFSEDSLPARVYLLQPGEELRRLIRDQP